MKEDSQISKIIRLMLEEKKHYHEIIIEMEKDLVILKINNQK